MSPNHVDMEPDQAQQNPFSSANATLIDGDEPLSSKISIRDVLSLLKTVVALKLLHTGASVFRLSSKSQEKSHDRSINQAIERREKEILDIILDMAPADLERVYIRPPPPPPSEETLLLTVIPTVPSTVGTHEGVSALSTVRVSTKASENDHATSRSSPPAATLVAQRRSSSDDGGKRKEKRSETYSTLPPPLSDSIYSSTLRRSLSVSDVPTLSSVGRRQGLVVSATQYTRIVSERHPEFSVVSQPLSIDSLIADGGRVDRSELELGGRISASKSVDSFPGRFPVSDGLEYSSLATVVDHLRVPPVRTSVRPFSDL